MIRKKVNVLVLGVGGNVSQGIVKALRRSARFDITIFGACISEQSVGLYMCDHATISPLASDSSFIDWYINYCNNHEIDIAFTGVEENIQALISHRDRIEEETQTKFVFPHEESWRIGADKFLTARWLEEHVCHYPDTLCSNNLVEVQAFLKQHENQAIAKPRSGKSSSGIFVMNSMEDVNMIPDLEQYVFQELIGTDDDEYTVGCYFDKKGCLVKSIIMHRYLKNGGTSICEIVQNELIEQEIAKIASEAKAIGPMNVQLRIDKNGNPVCFEWNVRYSGTTAIRNHFGFYDVEAAILEYVFEEPVEDCFADVAKAGCAVRFDDEFYFDKKSYSDIRRDILA